MTRRYSSRRKKSDWLIGLVVLVAISVAVTLMVQRRDFSNPVEVAAPFRLTGSGDPIISLQSVDPLAPSSPESKGVLLQGVVLQPDGAPASSATVTLYQMVTAWPEWRKQVVDEAITTGDGAYQFQIPHLYGHLLGCEHKDFAGSQVEVSLLGDITYLQLSDKYSISGYVFNDVGAPVPNARVSIESELGEQRRARFTYTQADGRYTFDNLNSGPAQLVARHESWQPARVSGFVVGDRRRSDFRFERPGLSPLRGRVVSSNSQEPIEGAIVELIPLRHSKGLSDTIKTKTDSDGKFLLGGMPGGTMRMWVSHSDFGKYDRTQAVLAVAQELTVELIPRTKLSGQLLSEEEGVFHGGEVLELRDAANELMFATVKSDGSFEFDRLVSPGFADIRSVGGEFAFETFNGSSSRHRLVEQATNEIEVGVVKPVVLRGRFVNERGAPLVGVRVTRTQLLKESVKIFGDAAWQLDFGKVGDSIAQLMNVARDEELAFSDDDGRFEIRGFRRGALLARVTCPGFGSRWLRMTVPNRDGGHLVEIGDVKLTPACTVSGRVIRGGEGFVGATVIMVSPSCQSSATTDKQGNYQFTDLVPGAYTMIARVSGRRSGSSERSVRVVADDRLQGVDIDLVIGRMVSGVVQDVNGEPLSGALVSERGRQAEVHATDENGAFRLELPRSAAELLVSFGDRTSQKIVPVSVDEQEVEVHLNTPPTSTVVGSVFGLPGRRRLSGVLLRLARLKDGKAVDRQTRWVTTDLGELRRPQVPSGLVRIEIWCDGYAPFITEVELQANEEHDIGSVLLERGASLDGIVCDPNGNAVSGAHVWLGEETDLDLYAPSVSSQADGTFTIKGVTSRSSHLVVRQPGFAASAIDLQLPRDVLASQPLKIELQRGTTIEVFVPEDLIPDDGLVYLRRGGRLLGSTVLDDKGVGWFSNRSVGQYTVMAFGTALPERQVEVLPGADVIKIVLDDESK